jgi:hypothetical protein
VSETVDAIESANENEDDPHPPPAMGIIPTSPNHHRCDERQKKRIPYPRHVRFPLAAVPLLDGVENSNRNDDCDFGFVTQALCFYGSDGRKST